jgi:transcriptional regulator with XRE-family HTH domain
MEIFARRLKELREEKGLTHKALALELGLNGKSATANCEKGIREPEYEIFVKMAKIFNTTTDYLLGITDKR